MLSRLTGPARRLGALACSAVALGLCTAGSAAAVDSVYWLSLDERTISHASLSGGGGADFPIPAPVDGVPTGMAIDAAAGRIYWIDSGSEEIISANLDGSDRRPLNTAE